DDAHTFDAVDQICRQTCARNEDCSYRAGIELPKSDPMLVVPEDNSDSVPQVCALDGLCRCPPESELDSFNQRQCFANTKPLLATTFTIGTIFLLLAITVVPIWTMTRKHRAYYRQQRQLESQQKSTSIQS